jgi:S1-C subfamily serine protease
VKILRGDERFFPASFLLVLISVLVLSGCVPAQQKTAPVLKTIDVPKGVETKPIAFTKLVLKVPRSEEIGRVGVGIFCIERSKIRARRGRYSVDSDMFTEVFRDELENANYKVVGDPDALFSDPSLDQAEYFIAGLIKDVDANACFPMAGFGDFDSGTANAYMKIEWQLYETLGRRVVYKTETEGSHIQEDSVDDALTTSLEEAFAIALQNLLADKEFYALVTGAAEEKELAAGERFQELVIKGIRLEKERKFDPVNVRPGVVTVRTATGHGSGFFISPDGYLLTNQHVVGGAKTVRIILHSGRHVAAEVLRTDSKRDIALLKVGEPGFKNMSLSFMEPPVGTEVLVYGTPLSESLEGTLTKGILSAYRRKSDGRFIQSDVTIQPGNSGGPMMDEKGNVIAITVQARIQGRDRLPTGHNFFIPLREAFEKLNIKVPAS